MSNCFQWVMRNGELIFSLLCMFWCNFFELSAAECSVAVEVAVEKLVREVRLEYQRHLLAMDKRSRMLQMRHALSRKLTRSKTMQW